MTRATTHASAAARRHLRFGWWALAAFAAAGLLLETLHGFKVRAYLDVANETRRLMWTLAHAHGSLLAIVNILYGLTLAIEEPRIHAIRRRVRCSRPACCCRSGSSWVDSSPTAATPAWCRAGARRCGPAPGRARVDCRRHQRRAACGSERVGAPPALSPPRPAIL
ncbi:MAG: hypothetical protein R2712_09025 [Vicinamibacterales bacterium]